MCWEALPLEGAGVLDFESLPLLEADDMWAPSDMCDAMARVYRGVLVDAGEGTGGGSGPGRPLLAAASACLFFLRQGEKEKKR